MRLGIRDGALYRLLGQPLVKSKGSLDYGSLSVTDGEREASLNRLTWYEMALMDEENKFLDQSPTQGVGGSSSSD